MTEAPPAPGRARTALVLAAVAVVEAGLLGGALVALRSGFVLGGWGLLGLASLLVAAVATLLVPRLLREGIATIPPRGAHAPRRVRFAGWHRWLADHPRVTRSWRPALWVTGLVVLLLLVLEGVLLVT